MRAVVRCPDKSRHFAIEIPTSAEELVRYWSKSIPVDCPHCKEVHLESFRALYSQAILEGQWRREVWENPTPPDPRMERKLLPKRVTTS